ncbi:MAG: hypothetical protein WCF12_09765, partial [Propionicimonas sp.]
MTLGLGCRHVRAAKQAGVGLLRHVKVAGGSRAAATLGEDDVAETEVGGLPTLMLGGSGAVLKSPFLFV